MLFSGCSDDPNASAPTNVGTPPPPVETSSTLVDFTAYAVEPSYLSANQWRGIAGASAFIELASGDRIGATSDADGKLVFHGVDFSGGPASVTTWAAGHLIATIFGVTPANVAKVPLPFPQFAVGGKDMLLLMQPIGGSSAETVKLSGMLTGKLDPTNKVSLSAAGGRGAFEDSRADYSLTVPKGQPLTLVAMEWKGGAVGITNWSETKLRWLRLDVPAQTADATVNLDLASATSLTSTKVAVNLSVPTTSVIGGVPMWRVQSIESGIFFLGSRNVVTRNDDKFSYKADGEYVASPVASQTSMTYAVFPGFDGESAFVQRPGVPADGETITPLAIPGASPPVSIGGDVVLSNIDPAAVVVGVSVLNHRGPNDDVDAWQIGSLFGSEKPASIHIPSLPDDALAMLPIKPSARVIVAGDAFDAAHPATPGRVAFSAFFDLRK
jgi:hypothetical protein